MRQHKAFFDEDGTYVLQENPFLFTWFPQKINVIEVQALQECGGVQVEVKSLNCRHKFHVCKQVLGSSDNRRHDAVMLVRNTQYEVLRGESVSTTIILN